MSQKVETESFINWRTDGWFPEISPEKLGKLKQLNGLLQKFSKTINLVSPKSLGSADAQHFADCIMACRIITEDAKQLKSVHDFGSGNGFPGIIFAVLYPEVKVTLVDSDQRKIEYLKACISECGLSNCEALNSTIEALAQDSVRVAMSRGLANISRSILLARKCMVKGGVYYHLKGDQWGLEVSQIPTQLCSIWTPSLVKQYKLPIGDVKYSVIKTDKIA